MTTALRYAAFALFLMATVRANITVNAATQKLPLLGEDVEVVLRDRDALVTGTFTFADRSDLTAQMAGKVEALEVRVPVVTARAEATTSIAQLYGMRLSVGSTEYDVVESRESIQPVGLPATARPVVLFQTVSKSTKDGKVEVRFRYMQPYVDGRFYYIPVLPRDWTKPADASEPRDIRLKIHIRADVGTVEVIGADCVPEPGGMMIYPRHLRVVAAQRRHG